jgi:hypothetical protein
MRRLLLSTCLAIVAASAAADRLILMPTAKKIPLGIARLEHMFDQSDMGRFRSALGVGLSEAIDAELTFEERNGRQRVLSLDVSYNIVPSVVGITPGFSVGVRDVRGTTSDGRFAYIAMTHKVGQFDDFSSDVPAEVTLGLAMGDRQTAFIGFMLPFRESFRLLGEFDTRRVSGAVEFRPRDDVWIRWIHRERQSLWSLTFVARL